MRSSNLDLPDSISSHQNTTSGFSSLSGENLAQFDFFETDGSRKKVVQTESAGTALPIVRGENCEGEPNHVLMDSSLCGDDGAEATGMTQCREFEWSSDEVESVEDPAELFDRGISVDLLLDLLEEHSLSGKSTRDVVRDFVLPQTADYECSLAGLMKRSFPEFVDRATHYVVHPWDSNFGRFVEMLVSVDAAYRESTTGETAMFWIDIFAIDQHRHLEAYSSSENLWLHRDDLFQDVRTCIEMIPFCCMFMEPPCAPLLMKRSWCLFECMQALTCGKDVMLCSVPEDTHVRRMASAIADFGSAIQNFTPDYATSLTFFPQDKEWLLTAASAVHPSGVSWLNENVGKLMLHWLCDEVLGEIIHFEEVPPLDCSHQLGSLLEFLGDYDQAYVQYLRALEIARDEVGVEHASCLAIQHDLACLQAKYFQLFDQSEAFLWETLRGKEVYLGFFHDKTNETVLALARLLQAQSRLDEAEVLFRRALETSLVAHGFHHRETLVAANSLALLLQDQGSYFEAYVLLVRVLSSGKEVLGAKHLDVLVWRNNLAVLMQDLKELKRAESIFRKALRDSEHALGVNHSHTLDLAFNLGQCLWQQGKLRAAETLFRRELAGCQALYGFGHGDTLRSVRNMADFLRSQGRKEEASQFTLLLSRLENSDKEER